MRRSNVSIVIALATCIVSIATIIVANDYLLRSKFQNQAITPQLATVPTPTRDNYARGSEDAGLLRPDEWRTIIDVKVRNGDIGELHTVARIYKQSVSSVEWEAAIKSGFRVIAERRKEGHSDPYPLSFSDLRRIADYYGYRLDAAEWDEYVNYNVTKGDLREAQQAAKLRGKPLSDGEWNKLVDGNRIPDELVLEANRAGKKFSHTQWSRILYDSLCRGCVDTRTLLQMARNHGEAFPESELDALAEQFIAGADIKTIKKIRERIPGIIRITDDRIARLIEFCIEFGWLHSCRALERELGIKLTEEQWRRAFASSIDQENTKRCGRGYDTVIQYAEEKAIRPTDEQLEAMLEKPYWAHVGNVVRAAEWLGRKSQLPEAQWKSFLESSYLNDDDIPKLFKLATKYGYKISRAQLLHVVKTAWSNNELTFRAMLEAAKENGQELTAADWREILNKEMKRVSASRTDMLIEISGIRPTKEEWTTAREDAVRAGDYWRAIETVKIERYFER